MSDSLPTSDPRPPTTGFFARAFSDDKGTPSSTRLEIGLLVLTYCLFILALIIVTLRTQRVPEVPASVITFLGMVQVILSYLKSRKDSLCASMTQRDTSPPNA